MADYDNLWDRRPRKLYWVSAGVWPFRKMPHDMNRQLRIELYKHARARKKSIRMVQPLAQQRIAHFVKIRRPSKNLDWACAMTFRREKDEAT